jgi:dienelactone hydrolase
MHDLSKVKSLSDWPAVRTSIETAVAEVLGDIPKERADLQIKTMDEMSFPGYTRKRISYFVTDWERIQAWLFVPEGKDEVPAILCCHQAVPQGKDEPAGIEGDPRLALAKHFAEQGYITIAPDVITAGDRVPLRHEPFDTRSFYKDFPRMSAIGKMIVDHTCALDVLCETKRVDPARLGVAGHGLGGLNALFLAGYDERVQCCVASCAFTRFADDKDPGRWVREEGLLLLPQLKDAMLAKKYPFDWEHLLARVAPCPTLIVTALNDDTLSNTKSCAKSVKYAQSIYRLLGANGALEHYTHSAGHRVTQDTLDTMDDWFERWL